MSLGIFAILLVLFSVGLLAPRSRKTLWRVVGLLQSIGSGEFFLVVRSNGGDVVLVRSIWTAALLFAVAIGITQRLDPGATWVFSLTRLRSGAREHIEWFGALLAAAYAVYYSRFAAQWTYLAGLYNQIMSLRAQTGECEPWRTEIYAKWWAAFIEDAEDVHLALKPSYASLIHGLLQQDRVREIYASAALRGPERIARLERRIASVLQERGGVDSVGMPTNDERSRNEHGHSSTTDVA